MCAVVNDEAAGFFMNDGTTTFICPQMGEMTGFARTAPSYETHYNADETMGKNGWGHGYTFPCLFKAPGNDDRPVWILVSETGVNNYPGCKIVNNGAGNYKISFPIRFIDGYPGKYVVLARKSQQGKWYLTAINGTKETLKLKLPVDMFAVGQTVNVYSDKITKEVTPVGSVKKVKIGKKQTMEAVIPVNGAFLVTE